MLIEVAGKFVKPRHKIGGGETGQICPERLADFGTERRVRDWGDRSGLKNMDELMAVQGIVAVGAQIDIAAVGKGCSEAGFFGELGGGHIGQADIEMHHAVGEAQHTSIGLAVPTREQVLADGIASDNGNEDLGLFAGLSKLEAEGANVLLALGGEVIVWCGFGDKIFIHEAIQMVLE